MYRFKSKCVAWSWCITTLCFASSSLNTFQAKNNVRSIPASSALTLHLGSILVMHSLTQKYLQINLTSYHQVNSAWPRLSEPWSKHKENNLVETWCEHWSCCSCQKGMHRDEVTLNSEAIKPIVLAVIEICLSAWRHQSVSQIVSQ